MNTERMDSAFVQALAAYAGSPEEFEFERYGYSASKYTLHGQIVACQGEPDPRISILRTRSHVGEVHTMNLRYFLSASTSSGVQFINRVAHEWDRAQREVIQAREDADAFVKRDRPLQLPQEVRRSVFERTQRGLYVFSDVEDRSRKVHLMAKSLDAAMQFMAMQDLFASLDTALWYGMLWKIVHSPPLYVALECRRIG